MNIREQLDNIERMLSCEPSQPVTVNGIEFYWVTDAENQAVALIPVDQYPVVYMAILAGLDVLTDGVQKIIREGDYTEDAWAKAEKWLRDRHIDAQVKG